MGMCELEEQIVYLEQYHQAETSLLRVEVSGLPQHEGSGTITLTSYLRRRLKSGRRQVADVYHDSRI